MLKLAFDWALAGDDEPVAIADRPEMQRMMRNDDPAALLAAWIAMNAAIGGRVAALHHVLVIAADADPEAAALLATLEDQRAREPRGRQPDGGARRAAPGLDPEQAAAIADLLIDPCPTGASSSNAAGHPRRTPGTSSGRRRTRYCRR